MTPPPVVLLAGGLGLRLRDDGDDLPKSLRPLPDGRPLLLHVLDHYRARGLREFVVCVGYRADAVGAALAADLAGPADRTVAGPGWTRSEHGDLRLTLVDSGAAADKCRRLLDARPHVGRRRFLLGYGDVLSDLDLAGLLRAHAASGGLVTMVVARVRARYGRVVLGPGTRVTAFTEKPVEPDPVSAGYFACEPELFDELDEDLGFESDVLARLAVAGRLHAYQHGGLWVTFDTHKDFVEAAALVAREGYAWNAPS